MKSETKELGKSKFRLNIEVEAPDLIKYFKTAYEKFAPDVKISGFRPGKAREN